MRVYMGVCACVGDEGSALYLEGNCIPYWRVARRCCSVALIVAEGPTSVDFCSTPGAGESGVDNRYPWCTPWGARLPVIGFHSL